MTDENILYAILCILLLGAFLYMLFFGKKRHSHSSQGSEGFQLPSTVNVVNDAYVFYDYGGGPKHQANWSQGVAFQPFTPLEQGLYTGLGWRSRYQLPETKKVGVCNS